MKIIYYYNKKLNKIYFTNNRRLMTYDCIFYSLPVRAKRDPHGVLLVSPGQRLGVFICGVHSSMQMSC